MRVKRGAEWEDAGAAYGRVAPENATAEDMADDVVNVPAKIHHAHGRHINIAIADARPWSVIVLPKRWPYRQEMQGDNHR